MANSSKKSMIPLLTLSQDQLASIHTIGNDVGDTWIYYAAVDGEGKVIAEGRIRTRALELQRLYAALGSTRVRMVLETGTHSPWISRLLKSMEHEVIVANSRDLHMIFKSKKKRDRVDAQTLAKVGRFDTELLHPVHHRREEIQRDLMMIRTRDSLVAVRTKLINLVRGMIKTVGERLPGCSADAFGSRMKPCLPVMLSGMLTPLVDQVASLTEQIRAYDKQVEQLIEARYPSAKVMMAIDGVGPLTALTFVLLVEDARRFSSSRSVGAYFGLVPALDESGQSQPQKRITKRGDALMRRLLVNAAHFILGKFGKDSDLRRHGLGIAERGGKNAKKRAVVAVARKLTVIMHHLWASDVAYDPLFNAKRQLKASEAA